ncbi:MAG TPA: hypothetical protein VHH35_09225, partial [Pyrinomonadaceae bacterium]|nr:hypothetical protein [Pyrinomonadaceae bacterium]
ANTAPLCVLHVVGREFLPDLRSRLVKISHHESQVFAISDISFHSQSGVDKGLIKYIPVHLRAGAGPCVTVDG